MDAASLGLLGLIAMFNATVVYRLGRIEAVLKIADARIVKLEETHGMAA